jgi:hypothetical protein
MNGEAKKEVETFLFYGKETARIKYLKKNTSTTS